MATFSSASNFWTLRYDQFGGICWQNSATQELYYIPPGQPPSLPPRSLTNGVRPNFPNNLPVTPSSTAHPQQNSGGPVHFNNNNPALGVSETARVESVPFVGCPQPHSFPSMLTEDGNQYLPPWSMPNAPRQYVPTGPFSTPTITARAQTLPPQQSQAGGTGVHFNNNFPLEEPKTAWMRPESIADGMGPYSRPPMLRTESTMPVLPQTRSLDTTIPNLPPEPYLTATADDRPRVSLPRGEGDEGQFGTSSLKMNEVAMIRRKAIVEDKEPHPSLTMARSQGYGEREPVNNNSVMEVTETARMQPKAIAEDKKLRPSLTVARVGGRKHELSAKSLSEAPRSSISNDPPVTPDATQGAKAFLTRSQGYGKREQLNNNSVMGVTETARLRPKPIAEEKKPRPSLTMPRVEGRKHQLVAKSLSNSPRSSISNDPPITPDAKASPIRGYGEREQFRNNSVMGVTETARLRRKAIAEEKPRPSLTMARGRDTRHKLVAKGLSKAPRLSISNDPPITPDATLSAKASPIRGYGEREQFSNNSVMGVTETARLRPKPIAEEKKPRPSLTMPRVEGRKLQLVAKSLSNSPRSSISNDPPVTPDAKASPIRGYSEREQFSNNSVMGVTETARLQPKAIAEEKPRPSLTIARVRDTRHKLVAKSLSKAPRLGISNDPPITPDATLSAKASPIRGYGEREQISNNSVMGETEMARLRPKAIAEEKPRPSLTMARVRDTRHKSVAKGLSKAPRSSISNDPPVTQDATLGAKASPIRSQGYGEREQFNNHSVMRPKSIAEDKKPRPSLRLPKGNGEHEQFNKRSSLGIPDATKIQTALTTEDKAPYSSTLISNAEGAKHEFPRNTLSHVSPPNLSVGPFPATSTKHRAKEFLQQGGRGGGKLDTSTVKASESTKMRPKAFTEDKNANPSISMTRGNGAREKFGNNPTLKVPAGVELRSESTGEETKPCPSPLVSTAEDTRHELSLKRLSNAPRRNIMRDPPFNATASAHTEASLISASGEGGQFDNNSVMEIPETAPVSGLGTNPRPSASISRAEEAKQWSRKRDKRGREYFFNIITGQSQSKKPDSLKKYTCRR